MYRVFAGPVGNARLLFALVLAAGGVCGLVAANEYRFAVRVATAYRTAPATVDRLVFDTSTDWVNGRPVPEYTPVLAEYHFVVGDRTYNGTQTRRLPGRVIGESGKGAVAARYGSGVTAECRYDPDDPTDSVLVPPSDQCAIGWMKAAAACGIVGAVGLGVLALGRGTTALRSTGRRPLTWGPDDDGPSDPLARTRRLYRDKLEG